eukprot:1210275-Rhodomonas_salina.3
MTSAVLPSTRFKSHLHAAISHQVPGNLHPGPVKSFNLEQGRLMSAGCDRCPNASTTHTHTQMHTQADTHTHTDTHTHRKSHHAPTCARDGRCTVLTERMEL